jgi:exopolysaccharide production protein ExoZ
MADLLIGENPRFVRTPMQQRLTTNHPARPAQQTIVTLQVLRGVAALLVVFAHSIDYQQTFLPGHSAISSFYSLENFGAVGVDIFFVISGFIMATIAPDAGEERAAIGFAAKRWIRIVPIYWMLTVVTTLLAAQSFVTRPRLISSFTFIPFYEQGHFLPPIILVGWTLSFELYFYLVIAVALAMGKRGSVVPMVGLIFAVLAAVGMVVKPHGNFAAFAFNPILAEFAIGCLIGHLYRKRASDLPLPLAAGFVACGLTCLIAKVVVGFGSISEVDDTLVGDAGTPRILMWGIPAGLLVAGCVFNERRWRGVIPGPLRLVGDASYSIYLLQLLALKQFATRWSLAGFEHPDLFIPVALLFATLAGVAHHGIVERPLTRWLWNRTANLLGLPVGGDRPAAPRGLFAPSQATFSLQLSDGHAVGRG